MFDIVWRIIGIWCCCCCNDPTFQKAHLHAEVKIHKVEVEAGRGSFAMFFDVLSDEPPGFSASGVRSLGSRIVGFGVLLFRFRVTLQLFWTEFGYRRSRALELSDTHSLALNQRRHSAMDNGGSAPSADEPFRPSLSRTGFVRPDQIPALHYLLILSFCTRPFESSSATHANLRRMCACCQEKRFPCLVWDGPFLCDFSPDRLMP